MELNKNERIREYLKTCLESYVNSITQKSKGKDLFVCPLCGSGTGTNGTGAFSLAKDKTKWKCFACGAGGDIFDLWGAINNETDHHKQFIELSKIYIKDYFKTQKKEQATIKNGQPHTAEGEGDTMDLENFFLQAHKEIEKTDYWKRRGLGREVIDRFKIGYVEEWQTPNNTRAPKTPRLIIPLGKNGYLARDVRDEIPDYQKEYSKQKAGRIDIFNKEALANRTKPVFVVEGEIDAMSIIEAGGEAIGLGSIANKNKFLEEIKKRNPLQGLILSMDNDKSGKEAEKSMAAELENMNIKHICVNVSGEYKDANEALQKEKEAFAERIKKAEEACLRGYDLAEKEAYMKNSTAYYLQDFIDGITNGVNTPCIPTGFDKLDAELEGGLYEGLYVVGAISSLGKTTMINQISDQIARAGHDVLMFSLEMARNEIIAKSISRHTIEIAKRDHIDAKHAKTTRGITEAKRYEKYCKQEKGLIEQAINEYFEYSENIYISEGVGDIGVNQIRETVAKHILFTGKKPLVIVDYIQILAPYNDKATDKQNTDKAVLELKRISRDYKIPVIGISSFNRASYKEGATMESFKESGAIEYSSDVLLGLQLKGAGTSSFDVNAAKIKVPREIEVVVLKNRNGRAGGKLGFNFYSLFNYFEEA